MILATNHFEFEIPNTKRQKLKIPPVISVPIWYNLNRNAMTKESIQIHGSIVDADRLWILIH